MIELKKSPVRFVSDGHKYFLGNKELHGITSTLIKKAYPDTYKKPDRYTDEEWEAVLANAAAKGSNMHETIELYDELGVESDLPELQSYIRIKEENNLTAIATEYVVSDEKHYATAIDKVMLTAKGEIILVDFKRTSVCHIDEVTLQQSICKRWFEQLNPGLKVAGIYVLWMRDDKVRFERLSPWADEMLDMLIESAISGETFDITNTYGDLPVMFAQVEEEVARLELSIKEAQERQKELKQGLYDLMEQRNIKSFTGSRVKLTRVLPTESTSFDSKEFKVDHPDIYKEYCKKTQKAGSLRITLI